VNNYDWTAPVGVLEFLRDIGKLVSVNSMVAKDSVRERMETRDSGISYAEFSYMLLQGFDFYHLRKTYGCELQVGATDQWGNITVGTENHAQEARGHGLGPGLPAAHDGRRNQIRQDRGRRRVARREAHVPLPLLPVLRERQRRGRRQAPPYAHVSRA
jgi:hypothetical protein